MTTRITKDEDPMGVARTVLDGVHVEEELYECQNCGKKYQDGEMAEITGGFWERHQPGDMVAAGECPDCGALCFPEKKPPECFQCAMPIAEPEYMMTPKGPRHLFACPYNPRRRASGVIHVCNQPIDGGRCGRKPAHKGEHLWPGEMRTMDARTRAITRAVRAERRAALARRAKSSR